MTLRSTDVWGTGPFENWAAANWAFDKISLTRSAKADGRMLCQIEVATACLQAAREGYQAALYPCPHLLEWCETHGYPADIVEPARLVEIQTSSPLEGYWKSRGQGQFREWKSHLNQLIERPKLKKPRKMSKRAVKEIVYRTHRGKKVGHLSSDRNGAYVTVSTLSESDAQRLSQFRNAVGLCVDFVTLEDEEDLEVPVRLLMQGWSTTLRILEVEVLPNTKTGFLSRCIRELASIPEIWLVKLSRCRIESPVFEALAQNSKTTQISLHSCEIDGRGLKHLETCQQLEVLDFSTVGQTDSQVKRLKKALPDTEVFFEPQWKPRDTT